jgi:hypothetical protein
MECPKCGGGAYLSEEDLIQVIDGKETRSPTTKLMLKATYACRACAEKFTRIVYDELNSRKKQEDKIPNPYALSTPVNKYNQEGYEQPRSTIVRTTDEEEAAESLKFF